MANFNDSDENSDFVSASSDCDDSFHSLPPSLHDLLDLQLSDVPKNFNVAHINAQSIPAHFNDFLLTFELSRIDAILISETWLKPCLPSTSYSLPGFCLIRNDRSGRGGGGVAIYLRSHIPYSILSMSTQSPSSDPAEYLFLELSLSHSKVLLGVFYSPSLQVNYFGSFEKLLEDLMPSYTHHIIMGDFNTCLLKNDSRSKSLKSLSEACNMFILPSGPTHFFPNCSPSLLDLTFVSSLDHVARYVQYSADAFSYHHLLFLSYKIRPPKAKPKILFQRNFSRMNVEKLREDASKFDWSGVFEAVSVDETVSLFNSALTHLYDVHAPIRPVKIKHLPAPWLTADIKLLIAKKNLAKSKFKSYPSDKNKARYHALRNRCSTICRDAQRRHIHNSVENGNPAKVWKFLKSLGVGKQPQNSVDHSVDLDQLNLHFSSFASFSGSVKLDTLNFLSNIPTPDYPPFSLAQFTDSDVKKNVIAISSNAVGVDNLSRNMILPLIDVIAPIITCILNSSISSNVFPSLWKDADVIPLPKKSSPSSFSDYRPISILPFLSKVLERLVHQQFTSFLNRHALMNPYQSGFRSGHSTTTALVKITDDIRAGMDNRKITVLSLLDFSNAFNTVDFDILLGILRSLNVSPAVVDWFRSYLVGRRQRIKVDSSRSSWCNTLAGVPQGGVLSPLLFSIFINSITSNILSSYHLYADDLQIYSQGSVADLAQTICAMNTDLESILDWSKRYGLKVNPTKTQVMVVGSSKLTARIDFGSLPAIVFDGIQIPFSLQVRNLGVMMDQSLSWAPQVSEVSRRMFAAIASLRRLRNFLPYATKIALAQSLLLPILDYADICYLDLTQDQLNKLERLQNLCIRFIFDLRKYDHVSQFRSQLKWLPIRLRRDSHVLALLYGILFNPATPPYLKERFKYLSSIRCSQTHILAPPLSTSKFYNSSFTFRAVRLWNALPVELRLAKSLPIFKNQLKLYFLSLP